MDVGKNDHAKGKPKIKNCIDNKDQYKKARKENLCFNCFDPRHAKANCPKLKTKHCPSDAKKDGKPSRQVHIMQRLSPKSTEFSKVVVSHLRNTHECCVTQTMWQPSIGPHDLVHMYCQRIVI